jgi:hypothetical protein
MTIRIAIIHWIGQGSMASKSQVIIIVVHAVEIG